MAKRKTGAAKRKAAGGSRSRSSARKSSPSAKRRAGRSARKTRKTAKKAARKSTAARKGASRKAVAGRRSARATSRKRATTTTPKRTAPKTSAARKRAPAKAVVARKAPALNRPRRTVVDEDLVMQTPPSSLDLDRSASAVRTGRREMKDRSDKITQTGPALTGGDVDADWESAYSVGDEAPGGDNPTPDQDIVDDIGRAVGVEYEDNEELKGEEKIAKRDRKRWELDPASSEDYNDRD
jgi:hypothetical protein